MNFPCSNLLSASIHRHRTNKQSVLMYDKRCQNILKYFFNVEFHWKSSIQRSLSSLCRLQQLLLLDDISSTFCQSAEGHLVAATNNNSTFWREEEKIIKMPQARKKIPTFHCWRRSSGGGGWVMEECGRLSKSSPHMFDKAHQLMWVLSTKERTAKLIPFPSYIYFLIIFTRSLFARSPWPKLNSMFTLMLVACRLVIVLSLAARSSEFSLLINTFF